MSVSFTGGDEIPEGFASDESPLGRVFLPEDGVVISGRIRVRYEKYPWIEKFEVDGIRPAPVRRTGPGTKDIKGFVRSLSTIYSAAFDDYRDFGGDEALDAHGYFIHAADHFIEMIAAGSGGRLRRMFCGYVENMWREGNEEILGITMDTILPEIRRYPEVWSFFMDSLTEEFTEYIDSSFNG